MIWEPIIFGYVISHFIVIFGLVPTEGYSDAGFAWLNPVWIYKHAPVNWFGAGLLALLGNIVVPGVAVLYWIYKLCTVGRR